MPRPNEKAILGLAAVGLLVALAASIAFGSMAEGQGWIVRTAPLVVLLGGGCIAAVGALAVVQHRRRTAMQYLEALTAAVDARANSAAMAAQMPSLPNDRQWERLLTHINETLSIYRQRAEDAEHARTAMEIRSRRQAVQRDRVNGILSNLGEPVIAIDDYDELVLANRSAAQLFGFDAEESVERRALSELVRCDRLLDLLADARQRRTNGPRSEELEIEGADGKPRWYRVTTCSMPSEHGANGSEASGEGVVAVLRDIAAQKEAQKRNAEFVSSASHEMKTPLAGIKAYVELLADGDAEDEETRDEFLDVINTQVERLERLIENLLNLARIEAGVVKVNRVPHSLNELLTTALDVVGPAAESKKITLTGDLSPLYLGALVDRDMMTQAAINLLSNAIKYTPAGGRVTLRSRMVDDEVMFEVQDTGVGLSPEDCSKVFEKFYRVASNSDMAPGTGLGLPLVKHIIEDVHNGRISLRSTVGEGSTFSVYLPNACTHV